MYDGVRLTFTIILALDVLPILLTIIGNGVCLLALLKTRTLHNPAYVLLGAMCMSDLFVGLIAQPLFIASALTIIQGMANQALIAAEICVFIVGAGCSFAIAMIISVDRYIAICHPFYYLKAIDCKKSAFAVGLASALVCCMGMPIALRAGRYLSLCLLILGVIFYAVIIFTNSRIYRVIKQQRKVMVTIGEIRGSTRQQVCKMHRDRSKTFAIAIMLLVLLIGFIPSLAVMILDVAYDLRSKFSIPMLRFIICARFISMLNSQ